MKDNSKSDEENRQDFIERIRAVLYRRKSNNSKLITSVARTIKRKKYNNKRLCYSNQTKS